MWNCLICAGENEALEQVCNGCLVKRGSSRIAADNLFVTHATSLDAYDNIKQNGFEIRKTATAGRSLGDVIYGYAYNGGSLLGSLNHAVGVCRERNQDSLAIFRVAAKSNHLLVFDQAKWEHILETDPDATSYQAYLRSHPNNPDMKNVVERAKKLKIEDLKTEDLSRRARELRAEEQSSYRELDRLTLEAKEAPFFRRKKLLDSMQTHVATLSRIEADRAKYSEDLTEDFLVRAAKELHFDGYYNLHTRITTFFDPKRVECKELLFSAKIPKPLLETGSDYSQREQASKELLASADRAGAAAFASFLNPADAFDRVAVSRIKLPKRLLEMGNLGTGVEACPQVGELSE